MKALNRFRLLFFIILISSAIYMEVSYLFEREEKKKVPEKEKLEAEVISDKDDEIIPLSKKMD